MTGSVTLLDASNQVVGTFATIQSAVNAASNGDTIELADFFYEGQVLVNGLKNLTIDGGAANPIITSPLAADLVPSFQNPDEQAFPNQMALVGLENGASVTLKNLSQWRQPRQCSGGPRRSGWLHPGRARWHRGLEFEPHP